MLNTAETVSRLRWARTASGQLALGYLLTKVNTVLIASGIIVRLCNESYDRGE